MELRTLLKCLIVLINLYQMECLKILGLFPYEGKSHYYMFKPYLHELAKRGHDVTIATHFPETNNKNLNFINLSRGKVLEDEFPVEVSYRVLFNVLDFLSNRGIQNCEELLEVKEIHDLIRRKETFDLVVTEIFNSDCTLGIAYKLNSPVLGIISSTLLPHSQDRFGIPRNPSYLPFHFRNGGSQPNYFQRIESYLLDFYFEVLFKITQSKEEELLSKHYTDIPPLEELARNIKLLLINHYFTLRGTMLNPSNIIEVAGLHVAEPKVLPKDIATFIDEAEHGVIYVSFGSLVKASTLPKDKLEILLSVFKELPQRIIWKWEEEELPGKPKNILTKKWLPQNDILAHPNVKAFLSHAGMLGTIEAVTYGVPVVNIPILGDQPSNAAFLRERGFGVTVYYNELSKEGLLSAFKTVLSEEFRKKALEVTDMFNNRPMSPMDTAIFWTEFAAKHPNVSFTGPSAFVPLYQYYLLDIYGTFAAVLLLIYLGIKRVCCSTNNKTRNLKEPKTKAKVKKNN